MHRSERSRFLGKTLNPPNCPELRPIERYWALVKNNLKKTGQRAENVDSFLRSWKNCSEKVSEEVVQDLMKGVRRKVRDFSRGEEIQ